MLGYGQAAELLLDITQGVIVRLAYRDLAVSVSIRAAGQIKSVPDRLGESLDVRLIPGGAGQNDRPRPGQGRTSYADFKPRPTLSSLDLIGLTLHL